MPFKKFTKKNRKFYSKKKSKKGGSMFKKALIGTEALGTLGTISGGVLNVATPLLSWLGVTGMALPIFTTGAVISTSIAGFGIYKINKLANNINKNYKKSLETFVSNISCYEIEEKNLEAFLKVICEDSAWSGTLMQEYYNDLKMGDDINRRGFILEIILSIVLKDFEVFFLNINPNIVEVLTSGITNVLREFKPLNRIFNTILLLMGRCSGKTAPDGKMGETRKPCTKKIDGKDGLCKECRKLGVKKLSKEVTAWTLITYILEDVTVLIHKSEIIMPLLKTFSVDVKKILIDILSSLPIELVLLNKILGLDNAKLISILKEDGCAPTTASDRSWWSRINNPSGSADEELIMNFLKDCTWTLGQYNSEQMHQKRNITLPNYYKEIAIIANDATSNAEHYFGLDKNLDKDSIHNAILKSSDLFIKKGIITNKKYYENILNKLDIILDTISAGHKKMSPKEITELETLRVKINKYYQSNINEVEFNKPLDTIPPSSFDTIFEGASNTLVKLMENDIQQSSITLLEYYKLSLSVLINKKSFVGKDTDKMSHINQMITDSKIGIEAIEESQDVLEDEETNPTIMLNDEVIFGEYATPKYNNLSIREKISRNIEDELENTRESKKGGAKIIAKLDAKLYAQLNCSSKSITVNKTKKINNNVNKIMLLYKVISQIYNKNEEINPIGSGSKIIEGKILKDICELWYNVFGDNITKFNCSISDIPNDCDDNNFFKTELLNTEKFKEQRKYWVPPKYRNPIILSHPVFWDETFFIDKKYGWEGDKAKMEKRRKILSKNIPDNREEWEALTDASGKTAKGSINLSLPKSLSEYFKCTNSDPCNTKIKPDICDVCTKKSSLFSSKYTYKLDDGSEIDVTDKHNTVKKVYKCLELNYMKLLNEKDRDGLKNNIVTRFFWATQQINIDDIQPKAIKFIENGELDTSLYNAIVTLIILTSKIAQDEMAICPRNMLGFSGKIRNFFKKLKHVSGRLVTLIEDTLSWGGRLVLNTFNYFELDEGIKKIPGGKTLLNKFTKDLSWKNKTPEEQIEMGSIPNYVNYSKDINGVPDYTLMSDIPWIDNTKSILESLSTPSRITSDGTKYYKIEPSILLLLSLKFKDTKVLSRVNIIDLSYSNLERTNLNTQSKDPNAPLSDANKPCKDSHSFNELLESKLIDNPIRKTKKFTKFSGSDLEEETDLCIETHKLTWRDNILLRLKEIQLISLGLASKGVIDSEEDLRFRYNVFEPTYKSKQKATQYLFIKNKWFNNNSSELKQVQDIFSKILLEVDEKKIETHKKQISKIMEAVYNKDPKLYDYMNNYSGDETVSIRHKAVYKSSVSSTENPEHKGGGLCDTIPSTFLYNSKNSEKCNKMKDCKYNKYRTGYYCEPMLTDTKLFNPKRTRKINPEYVDDTNDNIKHSYKLENFYKKQLGSCPKEITETPCNTNKECIWIPDDYMKSEIGKCVHMPKKVHDNWYEPYSMAGKVVATMIKWLAYSSKTDKHLMGFTGLLNNFASIEELTEIVRGSDIKTDGLQNTELSFRYINFWIYKLLLHIWQYTIRNRGTSSIVKLFGIDDLPGTILKGLVSGLYKLPIHILFLRDRIARLDEANNHYFTDFSPVHKEMNSISKYRWYEFQSYINTLNNLILDCDKKPGYFEISDDDKINIAINYAIDKTIDERKEYSLFKRTKFKNNAQTSTSAYTDFLEILPFLKKDFLENDGKLESENPDISLDDSKFEEIIENILKLQGQKFTDNFLSSIELSEQQQIYKDNTGNELPPQPSEKSGDIFSGYTIKDNDNTLSIRPPLCKSLENPPHPAWVTAKDINRFHPAKQLAWAYNKKGGRKYKKKISPMRKSQRKKSKMRNRKYN